LAEEVEKPGDGSLIREVELCRRGVVGITLMESVEGPEDGTLTAGAQLCRRNVEGARVFPAQAAQQVGLSPLWCRALLKHWNADGPAGLADRRVQANGGQSKLTPEQHIDLWAALRKPPPDGGLWTAPKVAASVGDRWGVRVCKPTGWEWLRGLGFSPQVPRPSHPEAATPAAKRAWKRRPGRSGRRPAPGAPRQGGRGLGRG
jgi:transposase